MKTEISITIPKASVAEAKSLLGKSKAVLSGRIIGETATSLGVMLELATITPLSGGMARSDIEDLLQPLGGHVGAKSVWLNDPCPNTPFFDA